MNNYYNTTGLTGMSLWEAVQSAKNSKDCVLIAFTHASQIDSKVELTPFEVKRHINMYVKADYPITSIRRAMTDLTSGGYLEKTTNRRQGEHGSANFTWKLVKTP